MGKPSLSTLCALGVAQGTTYWSTSLSFLSCKKRMNQMSLSVILSSDILWLTGLISLLSKGLSRVFSNTTVQKHQFFSSQLSLQSNSHSHTWLPEKPYLWLDILKDWRQEEKGMTEDEMIGWHHQLNGHEFEQAPGDGEGYNKSQCTLVFLL